MLHLLRHTTAIAVICSTGFAVAGCGGSSSAVSSGAFDGSTSQGLPISFFVTPSGVGSVQFEWRAKCDDGHTHTNEIVLGDGQLRSGAFSVGGTLNTGADAEVNGTVHGDTASGELSRSGPSAFGTDCLAAGISWHARSTSG